MPKIIENPQIRLMEEARRQIETAGYAAMTVRSVAKACGMGVGTVYNYFTSKDELLARCMLDEWSRCIAVIEAESLRSSTPVPVVQCICTQLREYARQHEALFRDGSARAVFAASLGRYHGLLREQLAAPLERFCPDRFTAQFVAESLLTWTMAGADEDRLCEMAAKLF